MLFPCKKMRRTGWAFVLALLAQSVSGNRIAAQNVTNDQPLPPTREIALESYDLVTSASRGMQAGQVKGCWDDNGCCGPWWCGWVGVEALGWAISGQSVPPLVTSSPQGTSRDQAGVIGAPGTQVLYGNEPINGGMLPGIRVYGGVFLDEEKSWGVNGSFFTLFGGDSNYLSPGSANPSAGDPVISRPFINANTGRNDAELVAFPGVLGGNVGVNSDMCFYGLDTNLFCNLCCNGNSRWDLLGGYRNMGLREGLGINENLTTLDTSLGYPANQSILVNDSFNTKNTYNGGQIGVNYLRWNGKWSLDARALLGVGGTSSTVSINGSTTVTTPGGVSSTMPGGLLAQRTNIGDYSANNFSFVPEVGVRLGYMIAPRVALTAGYNFIYWTGVARPGEQIDPVVNPTQIPPGTLQGPARPAFTGVSTTDIWIQGVSTGLEFRF
jgi:hypothetical protein